MSAKPRTWQKTAIYGVCTLLTLWFLYQGWWSPAIGPEMQSMDNGNSYVLHWTGRLAAVLLLLAFSASGVAKSNRLGRIGRVLVRYRRTLGISMTAVMAVHLVAIVRYLDEFGHIAETDITVLILGGLGYFFIFAMGLTSNNYLQKLMGSSWGLLHRIGIYYLWLIVLAVYSLLTAYEPSPITTLFLIAVLATGFVRAHAILSRSVSDS